MIEHKMHMIGSSKQTGKKCLNLYIFFEKTQNKNVLIYIRKRVEVRSFIGAASLSRKILLTVETFCL